MSRRAVWLRRGWCGGVPGVGGVERKIGGSGFVDGEEGDDHLQGALHAEADEVSGPTPCLRREWASWLARWLSWR